MNESPIRRFCESSHRKLIVVIVTTLVGLVILIPLADDYFDKKESRRTLAEELEHARQTAKTLPTFEQRVAELNQQMEQFELRSISQESLSQYRSKLVDMIRSADCQVRRFDVSPPTLRPWLENDNPLRKPESLGPNEKATPFTLERRTIALTVDGSMTNIRALLEKLHEDEAFAYPQRLDLHGVSRDGGSVALELELWLFALSRHKST